MRLLLDWIKWIKRSSTVPEQPKSFSQMYEEYRDLEIKTAAKLAELQAMVSDMNRNKPMPLFPGHRDDEEGR
jgi:hypothetical protein